MLPSSFGFQRSSFVRCGPASHVVQETSIGLAASSPNGGGSGGYCGPGNQLQPQAPATSNATATIHLTLIAVHPSSLIPHPSSLIPHPSSLIPPLLQQPRQLLLNLLHPFCRRHHRRHLIVASRRGQYTTNTSWPCGPCCSSQPEYAAADQQQRQDVTHVLFVGLLGQFIPEVEHHVVGGPVIFGRRYGRALAISTSPRPPRAPPAKPRRRSRTASVQPPRPPRPSNTSRPAQIRPVVAQCRVLR